MKFLQLLRAINPLDLRGSWKTSLCGVIAILAAGLLELGIFPEYKKQAEYAVVVALGIGAMLSRDANKTSEDEGLKPKV